MILPLILSIVFAAIVFVLSKLTFKKNNWIATRYAAATCAGVWIIYLATEYLGEI